MWVADFPLGRAFVTERNTCFKFMKQYSYINKTNHYCISSDTHTHTQKENLTPTTVECSLFSMKNQSDVPSCMRTCLVVLGLPACYNKTCMIHCWVLLSKKESRQWHVLHVIACIYNRNNFQNIQNVPKSTLTVRSDDGASNDLLSMCIMALQCGTTVSEVPQWQDRVCGVDSVWQTFIHPYVIQCPEDFARDARSEALYFDTGSRFNVRIFRANTAVILMLACGKW